MLPAFIGPIVTALGAIGKSWLENRRVKAEGKIAITHAKIAYKVRREEMKAEMDLTAMQGMQWTWKDEYLLVLLSIPAIMCFIPDFTFAGVLYSPVNAVHSGFEVLKTMPAWYQWAFTGIIAATFGLRTWMGFKK